MGSEYDFVRGFYTTTSFEQAKRFEQADLEWLRFVVQNRQGKCLSNDVDLYIGPVAGNNERDGFCVIVTIREQRVVLPEIIEEAHQSTVDWVKLLSSLPQTLFSTWEIEEFQQEANSRFGLVFYANSSKYGSCVVKLIAPEYFSRYAHEKEFYLGRRNFPSCELLTYSDCHHALLLKMAKKDSFADLEHQSQKMQEFFIKVKDSHGERNASQHSFESYRILLTQKKTVGGVNYPAPIEDYISRSIQLYQSEFEKAEEAIIHGDLHRFNILDNGTCYCAIDPIGIVAPAPFEYVRFIGTEVLLSQNPCEALKASLSFFKQFSELSNLLAALFIDCSFRLHNSVSECLDDRHTKQWLSVMKQLEPFFKTNS